MLKKGLTETEMEECNTVLTHMELDLKLSKAHKVQNKDEKEYKRNIGCLRYLIQTRPDLFFCVEVLSRYMQTPKQSQNSFKTDFEVLTRNSCTQFGV